jgi:D-alanine-D-alanine ligase
MNPHKKVILGFTYDLKSDYVAAGYSEEQAAEFDSEETIEGIANALQNLGYIVDRIGGVQQLLKKLVSGKRWDLVFNICEGLHGPCREAQVPVILDLYQIPYVFSDGLVLAVTLDKGITKHIIRDHGIATAPFKVVRHTDDIDEIDIPFPLFVKPIGEGTGKGIGNMSKVESHDMIRRVCMHQMETYLQPVLVEEYLPGREITVGLIGNGSQAQVLGMMEVQFLPHEKTGIYSYHNKANYQEHISYSVPEKHLYDACAKLALNAWQVLGCKDAGRVDIRCDKNGTPNFMEVNPLAGLNPIHSDLPIIARMQGIEFQELIAMIMETATGRLGLTQPELFP